MTSAPIEQYLPNGKNRRWFRFSASTGAFLFFVAAAIAMTWPLANDLRHLISDPGDPLLSSWILHWDWWQFFRHPFHLFDADIFFPERLTLAFSENLFGVALFGFPLYFAGLAPITVYNVLFLLGMTTSALGAWALATELTGDAMASILAGLFYAFVPFRFEHLAHIQLQWGGFLPVLLMYLWRYSRHRRKRDASLFAVFLVLNAWSNVHYGIFAGFALILTLALFGMQRRLLADRECLQTLGVRLLAAAIFIAPIYAPYFIAHHAFHFRRSFSEILLYSATPIAFVGAGFRNRLYGPLTAAFSRPELQLFFGLLVPCLAVSAVVSILRTPRSPQPVKDQAPSGITRVLDPLIVMLGLLRLFVAVAGPIRIRHVLSIREPFRLSMLLAVCIALRLFLRIPFQKRYRNIADVVQRSSIPIEALWGIAMTTLGILFAFGGRLFFYRELYEIFRFALGSLRCPARGIVLSHLGLGVLAAIGVSRWRANKPRVLRVATPFALSLALLMELRAAPIEYYKADTTPLPASVWLANTSFTGGILELPMGRPENDVDYVYRTTEHHHPILNGYSGFYPRAFVEIQAAFAENPITPRALDLARQSQARLVIVHPEKMTGDEIRRTTTFLKMETGNGNLVPLAFFSDEKSKALVFDVAQQFSPPTTALVTENDRTMAQRSIRAYLEHPDPPVVAPRGWLNPPAKGGIFSGGIVNAEGWAESDAGMARIIVYLDGKSAGDALYGMPRPDVLSVIPTISCGGNCGFRFRVERVPRGKHAVRVEIVSKNGKSYSPPPIDFWMTP